MYAFHAGRRASLRAGSLALTVAATLLLVGCGHNNTPTAQAPATTAAQKPAATGAAPAKASTAAAAPVLTAAQQAEKEAEAAQARMNTMGVDQLLAGARTAVNQQRLVAPKGNNAFEFYEKVLEKDPKNQVAADALRETFTFGANAVEQTINSRDFDEAQREIALLAKADPTNYTLTILRSKLDAQQKLAQRDQAQQAKQAADLAAKQAAAQKAAQEAAQQPKREAAPPPVAQAQPAPAPVQQQPALPPKPVGETRGAEVVSAAAPDYPVEAARNNTSGYAVVEFTVNPDGSVSGAHIVDSQPRRVFDSAAIRAVSRSHFKPALKDGQPVSSTLQRRIDFNLGG